ncbi:MAG: histidinol dehydrogenase, partial [Candidatus Odinarchaeota archaeon]
ETSKGVFVGQKYSPLKSVGVYVPGGRASYPSTVLMAAVPAKVAGVEEIILCSPPALNGGIDPSILVAANEVGVSKIYKIGGAQAIAAMAYGTETIPRVEKIIGPGNIYVTTAKLIVSSDVRIDLPAGPSEILILADSTANSKFIAHDLIAQAEHDPNASCILLAESTNILNNVIDELNKLIPSSNRREIIEKALESNSLFIHATSLVEALNFINDFAPEHLELLVSDPFKLLPNVKNAGAIFLGEMSPVAVGDLIAGSNHILPTGGYAKTYSGLTVNDFIKSIDLVYATRDGLKKISKPLSEIAVYEKLFEHKKSV